MDASICRNETSRYGFFSDEVVLRESSVGTERKKRRLILLLAFLGAAVLAGQFPLFSEGHALPINADRFLAAMASEAPSTNPDLEFDALQEFEGLKVQRIGFEGVDPSRFDPLPERLAEIVGSPLTQENLARGLRAVFATGLFESVDAEAARKGDGVELIFKGVPRTFIGIVSVNGAKGATINTQLERASRLQAGTRYTEGRLDEALKQMRQTLADNGFHQPAITQTLKPHPNEQLVDLDFEVVSGPQSHIGTVKVNGESGMSLDEFRRHAGLRAGAHIDRDTVNRALSGVLKHYQKEGRLEAEVKLESEDCANGSTHCDFVFTATRGPIVRLRVQGASIDNDRLKRAIPVYEEGTVDEDLLNEGNRRLRDYFQRLGYFDVRVEHERQSPSPNEVVILYSIALGQKRRVERVNVSGNRYFSSVTLKDLLSVRTTDAFDRRGVYNQALVSADVNALQGVYQNNGFRAAKITPKTSLVPTGTGRSSTKPAGLAIEYQIDEGIQQRVGSVTLEGNVHVNSAPLLALLNTAPGQLLSPQNLAGDRDTLLTDYLSRGFDQAESTLRNRHVRMPHDQRHLSHHGRPAGLCAQSAVDGFVIHAPRYGGPGNHASSRRSIEPDRAARYSAQSLQFRSFQRSQRGRGESERRRNAKKRSACRRPKRGAGLSPTALDSKHRLEPRKTTARDTSLRETRRYTVLPERQNRHQLLACWAISPATLFGREESASIQGTYGLLEQKVNLIFQNPHFLRESERRTHLLVAATPTARTLQPMLPRSSIQACAGRNISADTGKLLSRANTFIYEFDFRRVKVAASSLQVCPTEIPLLSQAVRVAGPRFTWLRDTRDSPLDAHRGTYTSFQDFLSNHAFGVAGAIQSARPFQLELLRVRQGTLCAGAQHALWAGAGVWAAIR